MDWIVLWKYLMNPMSLRSPMSLIFSLFPNIIEKLLTDLIKLISLMFSLSQNFDL